MVCTCNCRRHLDCNWLFCWPGNDCSHSEREPVDWRATTYKKFLRIQFRRQLKTILQAHRKFLSGSKVRNAQRDAQGTNSLPPTANRARVGSRSGGMNLSVPRNSRTCSTGWVKKGTNRFVENNRGLQGDQVTGLRKQSVGAPLERIFSIDSMTAGGVMVSSLPQMRSIGFFRC